MKAKPDPKRDRESMTLPMLVAMLVAPITSPAKTNEAADAGYDTSQLPEGIDTGGVSDTDYFIA